jgi:DNA-binding MarR family transcriptional regulator
MRPFRIATAPAGRVDALLSMIEATTAVFHGLRALAVEVHGPVAACVSAGQASLRGVLYELSGMGPRSVPEMARRRLVSRQHVQMVVDSLLQSGLARGIANPAHRRSPLVELTAKGLKVAKAMKQRETRLWMRMPLATSEREIRKAVTVLNAVRSALSLRAGRGAPGRVRAGRAASARR